MKPQNIFLVRHGESEGNNDPNTYALKADYLLLLTPTGIEQAKVVGQKFKTLIPSNENIMFYISPLWRSRMTFELIAKNFDKEMISLREDPRIREQEWGHYKNSAKILEIDEQRDSFGKFYYRIEDGESCADVFDRVSDFMNSLHRDFVKNEYPRNVIIVTHGTTIRLFLMKWFHWIVEDFESLSNPQNCEIVHLSLENSTNKFFLKTDLKRKEVPKQFQYKWGEL